MALYGEPDDWDDPDYEMPDRDNFCPGCGDPIGLNEEVCPECAAGYDCPGCGALVSAPDELCPACDFNENGSNRWPR